MQEDDVVDWIKDHPLLYSKGLKEYKDVAKKQRLQDEKNQRAEFGAHCFADDMVWLQDFNIMQLSIFRNQVVI